MLTAGLSVAVAGGAAALLLYALARRRKQRLIPPTNFPRAKWDGVAVAAAFVLFILSAHFVQLLLTAVGFYRWKYGQDFPLEVGRVPTDMEKAAAAVRYFWASVVCFPFQLLTMAAIATRRGGPNPLTPGPVAPNVVSGYLTWLLVTPAAFSVFALANIVHTWLTDRPPDRHPLTLLGEWAGNLEWTLFIVQTLCIAPVLEELVFRGLLLPWLCQKRAADPASAFVVIPTHRSALVLGLAIAVAVLFHADDAAKAAESNQWGAMFAHLIPGAFFVALVPIYLMLPRYRRLHRHLRLRSPHVTRGILASSALFAAFHATVWPSPVPLMVLSVGIGYLSVRTQSLVGPVVVHSMFNAVSATLLLLGGPA